jgi:hypothetical protein
MGVKPGGWATNDIPTASEINSYFQQRDAWASFTPAWTNLSVGNGSNIGRYNQVGRIVHWYALVVFGSTTSISGSVDLTLPVEASRNVQPDMQALGYDASGGSVYPLVPLMVSTTTLTIYAVSTSASYAASAALSSTIPFGVAWTTSDVLSVGGTYEALSAP